ncbi:MAG TPA: GTPase Era [Hyphomicrobiaceae bacterium]|nr:GTPase Era [Hyphomicrobiaceae bacterium]
MSEEGPCAVFGPTGSGTRFGFVAVIGAPNAGKSTLVNRLVGTKVSIVSRKVQTTRMRVRGIAIVGSSQLVLVDTPGIFAPRRRLDRAMVEAAWAGAAEADLAVALVDAARSGDGDVDRLLDGLAGRPVRRVLALNKVDRLKNKSPLLALAASLSERGGFEAVFMISALTGEGVGDLAHYLARSVPEGPWHYAADQPSDLPLRLLAAEITRERIYDVLHEELPYASAVETTAWQERSDGSVRIEQTIYVERESQRKIVIGKGGATIKGISTAARRELTEIVERPVHLFLFVKVRAWGDDPERYRELGLDFPKNGD